MPRIGLEVCVDSPSGLLAAVRGGASRVELCSALALGGLTPSSGFMRLAATMKVDVFPMLRPHPGPFVYGADDIDVMRRDLDAAAAERLPGAVIGANLPSGDLDLANLETLCGHARGLGMRLTLHRAFDLVPDQRQALEQAIALGFERVLTSGGARTAPDGVEMIAVLVSQAGGRISVMPGSGLTPATLRDVMRQTGAGEAHGSGGRTVGHDVLAQRHRSIATSLAFMTDHDRETDQHAVEAMVAILDSVSRERQGASSAP